MPNITRLHSGKGADGAEIPAISWTDFDTSSAVDRDWLAAQSDLDEETKAQLLIPVTVNRREILGDGVLVSLRSSSVEQPSDTKSLVSLKIFLNRGRVITARSEKVMALDDLRDRLDGGKGPSTSLEFLAFVAACMAERLEGIILDISEDTDDLEDQLLEENITPQLESLSVLRRRIYRTRRQLASLKLVLTLIASDPSLELSKAESRALIKSSEHVGGHLEGLEDCRVRAEILQDQIEGRLSVNMSRSSYNLTIVATVFLPLTFVTGLLGMNVAGIPEAHDPWGFWTVCGALTLFAAACWAGLHWRMR